jgi:hypothetical protein
VSAHFTFDKKRQHLSVFRIVSRSIPIALPFEGSQSFGRLSIPLRNCRANLANALPDVNRLGRLFSR